MSEAADPGRSAPPSPPPPSPPRPPTQPVRPGRLPASLGDLMRPKPDAGAAAPPIVAGVVAVERYARGLPPSARPDEPAFGYDVTLTDGELRLKCSLAPGLNRLVDVNRLRAGCELRVLRATVAAAERLMVGVRFPVIVDAEVTAGRAAALEGADPDALPWVPGAPVADRPLGSEFGHYLSLWSSEDYYGPRWAEEEAETAEDDAAAVAAAAAGRFPVGRLEELDLSRRAGPPLLVRLLHRSRLLHFRRAGSPPAWPYRVYLEVCDGTGVASAVLWNGLCPRLYRGLRPGRALVLRDYTLRRAYPSRTWPDCYDLGLPSCRRLEVHLNARDPAADVRVVPAARVDPAWRLPEPRYRFVTRRLLDSLPAGQACDVAGVVLYVGRQERLRKKGGGGGRPGDEFWSVRWVHAFDATSPEPFVVRLFPTSQPETHELLAPVTLVVCTQMRVARGPLGPYLESSVESQVFVSGQHAEQPYATEPAVVEVAEWCRTLDDREFLPRAAVGGCYVYPPPPTTLEAYVLAAAPRDEFRITPLRQLRAETDALHYRERGRLVVQGTVAEVCYVEPGEAPAPEPRKYNRRLRNTERRAAAGGERGAAAKRPRLEAVAGDPSEQEATAGSERHLPSQSTMSALSEEILTTQPPAAPPPDSRATLWETPGWPEVQLALDERLRFGELPAEAVVRRYDHARREEQMRLCGLQPGRCAGRAPGPAARAGDFPPACGRAGHFVITVLGLDRKLALEVPFVPVWDRAECRPAFWPDARGDRGDGGLLEMLAHGSVPAGATPLAITESASLLNDRRMVFVLDQCRLGPGCVEVTLNRAYPGPDG